MTSPKRTSAIPLPASLPPYHACRRAFVASAGHGDGRSALNDHRGVWVGLENLRDQIVGRRGQVHVLAIVSFCLPFGGQTCHDDHLVVSFGQLYRLRDRILWAGNPLASAESESARTEGDDTRARHGRCWRAPETEKHMVRNVRFQLLRPSLFNGAVPKNDDPGF